MIEILHDLIYQNCRNYGSTTYVGSCRISIINCRNISFRRRLALLDMVQVLLNREARRLWIWDAMAEVHLRQRRSASPKASSFVRSHAMALERTHREPSNMWLGSLGRLCMWLYELYKDARSGFMYGPDLERVLAGDDVGILARRTSTWRAGGP